MYAPFEVILPYLFSNHISMIKIYGSKMSSAARCIWLLEEVGAEYEIQPVDFQKGEHKAADYLKLNPNGKVPTLVDGSVVVWESLAINGYIAEKFQPELLGKTLEERALVNQWSLWALMHLYGDSLHALVMKKWRNTPETDESKQAFESLPKWLGILNSHLTGKDYVLGAAFTLADLNVASVVNSTDFIGYDLAAFPEVKRWMGKIAERPAVKKMMAK